MPELAEVETLKRYLEKHIIGDRIILYKQNRHNIRYDLAKDLKLNIENQIIEALDRRAKYLLIHLNNNKSIIIHLGMSGRFTIKDNSYATTKHDHVEIHLASGRLLIFNDPRRFGMVYCVNTDGIDSEKFIAHFGPEPLSDHFNHNYLMDALKKRKAPIKNMLMDNTVVVGVGNIYAAESLFLAKIHPQRIANTINEHEVKNLVIAVKEVLNKAIAAGGTTLRDFVSGNNEPGYFKQELNVYGREDLACKLCTHKIKAFKQAGRSSYYCTYCQV